MVRDAGLVTPNVLPSGGMSSVQSSSAAERAIFPRVGHVNGCSRGVNESKQEIPVNWNNPPFGEDHGDHKECKTDALTLNEVSGAAVPVTWHTHPPEEPCLTHSPADDGTRDRALSKCADVVTSETGLAPQTTCGFSYNTRRDEQQDSGLCLFSENLSAQVPYATRCTWSYSGARSARDHVSSATDRAPSRPTATTATLRNWSQAPLPRLRPDHGVPSPSCSSDVVFGMRWWLLGNVLVRVLSRLHLLRMLGQWRTGCLGNIPPTLR